MTAEDLRKSILQQTIQGKLVPQDPNDEPAAVLLERIREEKARLIKEKKIKKDKNESIIFRGDDNSYYEKILATGEVKCIDDEIPFDIPEGWEWVRFSTIINLLSGRDLEANQYNLDNKGIPYMTGASNFSKGELLINRWTQQPATISHLGDLLITCKGTIGEMAYNRIGDIHIARQIMAISPKYVEIEYVQIYLSTLISKLNAEAKSIIPGISRENILNAIVSLPPIDEQKRIIKKVTLLYPCIEKYKIAKEEYNVLEENLIGNIKKSILQEAIQGKLVAQCDTDEPATDLLKHIHDEKLNLVKQGKLKRKDVSESTIFRSDDNRYYEKVGSIVNDITDEIPYELPETWSFVRLSSICYLDDGIKHSGEKLPYMDAKFHRGKGDITYLTQGKIVEPPCKVILVDGENSGEIFNITERGYLGSTFKILRIANCISEEWLHLLFDAYRDVFKNSKVGAAIPHLNKNLFRNLIIGLPPYEEQIRITEKVLALQKSIEGV